MDTYYTGKKRLSKSHRRDAIPYRFELWWQGLNLEVLYCFYLYLNLYALYWKKSLKYIMLFVGCLVYFCIILWYLVAGYGANLRKAFGRDDNHKWPRYLKTHDYHRLLQHILPVAIIGLASAEVQDVFWSLGNLLRWVCSKELFVEEIPRMRVIATEVVCKLEKAFPPSFFDCQVHLLVHLVD